jgi:hypothetical protein
MKKALILLAFFAAFSVSAQNNLSYWQQHADYTMDVDVDVKKFQYKGTQQLTYTNNSPDVLKHVYYHLYYNAFQPGSEMDARLQSISDPDRRMVDNIGTMENPRYESRISKLKPEEIGYLNVLSLTQDGKPVNFSAEGTVLEVRLNTALKPGEKTTFDMNFEGQLPVHIRRAGRNSRDGVAMSMAQWYPKMAEYDFEGWHAHPYIAREFHGVWGNFDVTLHIDKDYTVGGTGDLQNPQEVGHGYEDPSKELNLPKGDKLRWHFKAEKVHDFTWAADPEYAHDIVRTDRGVDLHFFYKDNDTYRKAWTEVQPLTAKTLDFFSEIIGEYPWKQYSVIQGGDGGMEYAMCTLIAGGANNGSVVGTMIHEFAHTWFQQILANNESKHSWMDEGFASYVSGLAADKILRGGDGTPGTGRYRGYYYMVNAGIEEPLTTHADHFHVNRAFGTSSYTKGSMFMSQLNYIIGEENVRKTIKKYFEDFKFKHPTPVDVQRSAEKVSGLHLGWYLNQWTETTNTIDYAVSKVEGRTITLSRIGKMPMPIDVRVTYTDGSEEDFNIPLRMMRGHKPTEAKVLKDWTWAHPDYSFQTTKDIAKVQIDPSGLMADMDADNNSFTK